MIIIDIYDDRIVAKGHAGNNEVCARVSTVLQAWSIILEKKVVENNYIQQHGATVIAFENMNKNELEIYKKFMQMIYDLKELYPAQLVIRESFTKKEED